MPTGVGVSVSPALGGAGPAAAAPTLAAPTMAQMTTAAETKRGDADMLTWAGARPVLVDQFGKIVVWIQYFDQGSSTKYHIPVVSNDLGATWTAPTRTGFANALGEILMIRGGYCYVAAGDQMAMCCAFTQVDAGVYVRFYAFTRDGSNNITGVTRSRQMQLEVGVAGMGFESPGAVMTGTKLVLTWGALNPAAATTKAAIRATSIVPAGSAADATATNYLPPLNENAGSGVTSDPLSSSFVASLKYSILAQGAANALPYCALDVLASGDLAFATALGGGAGTVYWNRAQWSGANSDWRTGLKAALANDAGHQTITAIGASGYALKNQLYKIIESVAGVVGVIGPVWSGTADVVRLRTVTVGGTDSVSAATDVYSAGGAHSYAPTCDLGWQAAAARFVPAYIKTTTQFSFFQLFTSALAAAQGETALHAVAVDIPYVGPLVGGKTLFLDRDTTTRTLPDRFYGYAGAGAWS
jgi:hypothetical protein